MTNQLIRVPSDPLFVSVAKANRALAEAATVLEAKHVKDVAEAMRVWARAQKDGGETQRQAAEIVLRAERRLGELSKQLQALTKAEAVAERQDRSASGRVTKAKQLAEAGLSKQQAERYEKIASIPEDQFEALVSEAKDAAKELTTAAALRVANGGVLAAFSSESVEWYTPSKYIEAARQALGSIDLDPASSPKANETVQAKQIFTEADDGLVRPWFNRVWLNPPYAKDVTAAWVEKLADECETGHVTAAVLLVNAVPDRSWFVHVWSARLLCFTDHRIEFYTPTGQPRSPVCSNVFAYWGRDELSFSKAFSQFGTIVRKV